MYIEKSYKVILGGQTSRKASAIWNSLLYRHRRVIWIVIVIYRKGSFTDSQWIKFCKLVYGKDEEDIPIVMEIFNLYDVDGSKSLVPIIIISWI